MSGQFFSQLPEVDVTELSHRLETNDLAKLQLIDVREPEEVAIAYLPGFTNLPLSQFTNWADNIAKRFDPHKETLVICHHGVRSAQMCHWLQTQGFTNVKNVAGGIDAYAVIVDPTIPRY